MINQILVGLGAGVTAALLYLSASTLSPLAVVLFYLGPLPIFLATLGWGKATGAIAGLAAALAISAIQSLPGGVVFLGSVALPAFVLSHLARLARQGRDGTTEWYPVGRLVLWASLMSGAITVTSTLLLGIGMQEIATAIGRLIERLVADNPELSQNREALSALANTVARVVVPLSSVSWATALVFNLWLAGRVLRYSDRLPRPWPDLHRMALPPRLHFALLGAIVLSFTGGIYGFIAMIFAGCLALVYVLVGLSIIHYVLPEQPARPLVLAALYFVLVFLSLPLSLLPLLLVAGVGLVEPLARLRARAAQRRGEPAPPVFL